MTQNLICSCEDLDSDIEDDTRIGKVQKPHFQLVPKEQCTNGVKPPIFVVEV